MMTYVIIPLLSGDTIIRTLQQAFQYLDENTEAAAVVKRKNPLVGFSKAFDIFYLQCLAVAVVH